MTTEQIKNHPTYKQVLADSIGGIMFNVDYRQRYDAQEIMDLWDNLTDEERETAGGIMKGTMSFLKGE